MLFNTMYFPSTPKQWTICIMHPWTKLRLFIPQDNVFECKVIHCKCLLECKVLLSLLIALLNSINTIMLINTVSCIPHLPQSMDFVHYAASDEITTLHHPGTWIWVQGDIQCTFTLLTIYCNKKSRCI